MTQLAPSTLLYGQAVAMLDELKRDFQQGKFKTSEEVAEGVRSIITRYASSAGQPLLQFEPIFEGEPPSSEKMNRYLRALQNDVNLLQDQTDLLKSASIFLHNFISNEIQKSERQNGRASNKMKTLQLYSNATDINMVIFGDYFSNDEFIDYNLIPQESRVSLSSPGNLTLGRETESVNLIQNSEVSILSTSNGFRGNNHDILDPRLAPINPATGEKDYTFVASINPRNNLLDIIDGEPNTWFEYENHWVDPRDRTEAKNANFSYVREYQDGDTTKTELVNWALGPDGGTLKLNLEFDLKSIKVINNISYTPFGLAGDVNPPVKVRSVQVSPDATNWTTLTPQDVWIATDANIQVARTADEVTIGTAVWSFEQKSVRYIRINVEQPSSLASFVGHVYYETNASGGWERAEGPNPPIDEPSRLVQIGSGTQGNLVRKTEYFEGKRWAIGIRDCAIEELRYKTSSVLVSKLFRVNGIVDQVALEANVFIPPDEAFDSNTLWVKFFVSPDDGLSWYQISNINDDVQGLREIIAFNDPLPVEFQDPRVEYRTVNRAVTSLRVKAEISRPSTLKSSSPIIRWYKLKVRLR